MEDALLVVDHYNTPARALSREKFFPVSSEESMVLRWIGIAIVQNFKGCALVRRA